MKKLLPLLAALVIIACTAKEKKEGTTADEGANAMAEKIRGMEDSLFNNMAFDRRSAQTLLDVYKAYAAAYPLEHRAPEYLFRAAGVARAMKEPRQSIALYDRILRDYQSWERIPDVYYLKAFTIDTELGQKGEAREAYRQVIIQFPDHPFAKDAKLMIENLQYTDEELIQRFQQMQAEQGEQVQ